MKITVYARLGVHIMDVNNLVARTMNVSKEAQEKGFYETPDAFDDILDSLLEMLNSRAQFEHETPAILQPETQHLH